MSSDQILPLIAFAAISTVTPGATTTLATASGAHFGFRRSLPFMIGVAIGLAGMAVAAAAGLAGLLLALPSLEFAMKLAGSAYLLWLAVRIGRSGPPHLDRSIAKPTSFLGALWIQLQNPKGWAMTLGAAASFGELARGAGELAALLGTVFGVLALLSLMLWCVAGLLLARLLTQAWQWRALNIALALALAASIATMWR
ncbi:MAG: LysE family translocator [Bosea sp.]|uniref:LysE family translocator n=1 Tax=Bosea sp. (in: a-proteobacteria) TaxID=1871050 RepID=UPI00238650E9|nr:LysE family translocator [Bosea sp. (in: a-proteobacteria)]MCP4740240.1 LysE family translocator [Bosea sp. (in: a-proteobacteria)]